MIFWTGSWIIPPFLGIEYMFWKSMSSLKAEWMNEWMNVYSHTRSCPSRTKVLKLINTLNIACQEPGPYYTTLWGPSLSPLPSYPPSPSLPPPTPFHPSRPLIRITTTYHNHRHPIQPYDHNKQFKTNVRGNVIGRIEYLRLFPSQAALRFLRYIIRGSIQC